MMGLRRLLCESSCLATSIIQGQCAAVCHSGNPWDQATRRRSRRPGNSTKSIPKSESSSKPQCQLAINL